MWNKTNSKLEKWLPKHLQTSTQQQCIRVAIQKKQTKRKLERNLKEKEVGSFNLYRMQFVFNYLQKYPHFLLSFISKFDIKM